jgi:hypothetical protein
MRTSATLPGGVDPSRQAVSTEQRYAAWFHALDAWTEYWDVYRPETRGRFYFGDGHGEPGLLSLLLPRERKPPAFVAWVNRALGFGSDAAFFDAVREPAVAHAVMEIDALVERLYEEHFGPATDPVSRTEYLEAMHRFACDTLPPATERAARIADTDPPKATAGRHTLDGDLMWFAWALQLEAAHVVAGSDGAQARRALMLSGVATGCAANFAWRGHRRTRAEYARDRATALLLRRRGLRWAEDFGAAAAEVRALYRIREWGHDAA